MATVNVRELLSRPSNTVERPPVLPAGHFEGSVLRFEFGKSGQKKTPQVTFFFSVSGATSDVDEEDVAGINFQRVELRQVFYLTDKALYRLVDFLDAVQGESTENIDDRINELPGTAVIIGVRQRLNDDGEATGNDVTTVTMG